MRPERERPIGILDSGVGGLTVLAEIMKLLPHEDVIYFADSANFPYGNKSVDELQSLALQASRVLLDKGVKLIVVACNTGSCASLATLRATYEVPFVGMVPAIKPATAATRNGKVGVIATKATVQAEVFAELLAQFAEGVRVFTRACPGLVEMVERGEIDSPELRRLLHEYLEQMLAERIDTLVLGCTHYPFLRPVIREIVGESVNIIDSGAAIARQVERVLRSNDLLGKKTKQGKVTYISSGSEELFVNAARRLFNAGDRVDNDDVQS